jgi:hypothetical protein
VLNPYERIQHGHPFVERHAELAERMAVVRRMTRDPKGDLQAC